MNSRILLSTISICLLGAGCRQADEPRESLKQPAIDYFEGVYSGNSSGVAELVSDNIRISYPVFESLFGSPVIEGRAAAEGFAERFARKWGEPEIEFKRVIEEGDCVVLVWDFRAFDRFAERPDSGLPNKKMSWGGITLLQFDAEGKVEMELGEESAPGPYGRISGGDAVN